MVVLLLNILWPVWTQSCLMPFSRQRSPACACSYHHLSVTRMYFSYHRLPSVTRTRFQLSPSAISHQDMPSVTSLCPQLPAYHPISSRAGKFIVTIYHCFGVLCQCYGPGSWIMPEGRALFSYPVRNIGIRPQNSDKSLLKYPQT